MYLQLTELSPDCQGRLCFDSGDSEEVQKTSTAEARLCAASGLFLRFSAASAWSDSHRQKVCWTAKLPHPGSRYGVFLPPKAQKGVKVLCLIFFPNRPEDQSLKTEPQTERRQNASLVGVLRALVLPILGKMTE